MLTQVGKKRKSNLLKNRNPTYKQTNAKTYKSKLRIAPPIHVTNTTLKNTIKASITAFKRSVAQQGGWKGMFLKINK